MRILAVAILLIGAVSVAVPAHAQTYDPHFPICRSTQQWKDVPRGTMDEVSSHVCLNLPFKLTTRPRIRLFYLILESHDGRALVPIPKREPVRRHRHCSGG